MLQNMLESKKNFVRYISHEIRTPLNTVFMGIQLARKQLAQNNPADASSILHDVEESCVTAVDILNDILLYDKIEDGRMELDKTVVTAHKLVKSVADLFVVQVGVVSCLAYCLPDNVVVWMQCITRHMDSHKVHACRPADLKLTFKCFILHCWTVRI
jgi:signal transduction histidine kinase